MFNRRSEKLMFNIRSNLPVRFTCTLFFINTNYFFLSFLAAK